MLLAKGLSANDLSLIFAKCFSVLNIKFTVCGFHVSLMAFMLFGIVFSILLYAVFYLFRKYQYSMILKSDVGLKSVLAGSWHQQKFVRYFANDIGYPLCSYLQCVSFNHKRAAIRNAIRQIFFKNLFVCLISSGLYSGSKSFTSSFWLSSFFIVFSPFL